MINLQVCCQRQGYDSGLGALYFNVIGPRGIRFCPTCYRPFSKNSTHHVMVIVMLFTEYLVHQLRYFSMKH